MTDDAPAEKLLTLSDLAERWQVSERTVKRRIQAGEIKATRIGRQVRVDPNEARRYENRNDSQNVPLFPSLSRCVIQ